MGIIETHFADFIARVAEIPGHGVLLAARLVSSKCSEGHSCVNLKDHAGKPLPEDWMHWSGQVLFPGLDAWIETLMNSGVVGIPGTFYPMVLDGDNRLYLHRYWLYEKIIVDYVLRQAHRKGPAFDVGCMKEILARLFEKDGMECDWQKVGAIAAASRRFCIITGGPGTGKTTTAAKIIALLAALRKDGISRVALAAPTGKAASRLYDAVKSSRHGELQRLIDDGHITLESATLHRLLGRTKGFDHRSRLGLDKLPYDVVVVDETSMVDLPLMAKFLAAISDQTHLILLGDRDQLASVEPGAVYADLCSAEAHDLFSAQFVSMVVESGGGNFPAHISEKEGPLLEDAIIQLKRNYRFAGKSGIHQVISAIGAGDAQAALDAFDDPEYDDLVWHDLVSAWELPEIIRLLVGENLLKPQLVQGSAVDFSAMDEFCLLSPFRHGPFGVESLNALVRVVLAEEGKVPAGVVFFAGQPVMVLKNDYGLELFNGEVGIIVEDRSSPEGFSVVFPGMREQVRRIPPSLLPEYETVFSMTVHKSQGMEFNHVGLVIPDGQASLLTRELVYTAISRAREKVEVWGNRKVFSEAIQRRVCRNSGLHEALWKSRQQWKPGNLKL